MWAHRHAPPCRRGGDARRVTSKPFSLMRFRSQVAQFNRRTKTEHLATILLPNPVAAHDTSRHAMDGVIKISKENRILWNRLLRAEMGVAAFRVRRIQPLAVAMPPATRHVPAWQPLTAPHRQFPGAGSSGKWHFCQSADALA